MNKSISILILIVAFTVTSFRVNAQGSSGKEPEKRLYRLSCGNVEVPDLNVFSDTDAYIGKSMALVVSCYLITSGDLVILWDTGLPPNTPAAPDENAKGPFKLSLPHSLPDQLASAGFKVEDVDYVVVSHGHFDHTGGANLFPNATLVMQEAEFKVMTENPELAKSLHMDAVHISNFLGKEENDKVMLLSGDTDIFGDGFLKAIYLPGHTPGHMALLVNLPETGPVVLSGDQWHFTENRKSNGVPSFNYDRADTLASSDKLSALVKNRKARLIIQHESLDNQELPVLPEYLK